MRLAWARQRPSIEDDDGETDGDVLDGTGGDVLCDVTDDAGLDAERDAVCALFLSGDGMQRIRDFVARSERKKIEGTKA